MKKRSNGIWPHVGQWPAEVTVSTVSLRGGWPREPRRKRATRDRRQRGEMNLRLVLEVRGVPRSLETWVVVAWVVVAPGGCLSLAGKAQSRTNHGLRTLGSVCLKQGNAGVLDLWPASVGRLHCWGGAQMTLHMFSSVSCTRAVHGLLGMLSFWPQKMLRISCVSGVRCTGSAVDSGGYNRSADTGTHCMWHIARKKDIMAQFLQQFFLPLERLAEPKSATTLNQILFGYYCEQRFVYLCQPRFGIGRETASPAGRN